MKKFIVTVVETLEREVEIYASSLTEAQYKVENQYKNEDIVLTAEDYVSTDFSVKEAPVKHKAADMER